MIDARCSCGALALSLPGPTNRVAACHCIECQRRTGAPFGVGAFYPAEAVTTSGTPKEYVRAAESGGKVRFYFCPNCGSTVYWKADNMPGTIGGGKRRRVRATRYCASLARGLLRTRCMDAAGARSAQAGRKLDIGSSRSRSVEVVIAENLAEQRHGHYQLASRDRRPIDAFERAHDSLLILSHFAATAQHLQAFFARRIPLWEGHTRPALETLVRRRRRIAATRSASRPTSSPS
jgi:hypothetical protein